MITVTVKSTSGISDGEWQFSFLDEAEKFASEFLGLDSLDEADEYANATYTRPGGTTQVTLSEDSDPLDAAANDERLAESEHQHDDTANTHRA